MKKIVLFIFALSSCVLAFAAKNPTLVCRAKGSLHSETHFTRDELSVEFKPVGGQIVDTWSAELIFTNTVYGTKVVVNAMTYKNYPNYFHI